jgi:rabenosyn-5
MVQQMNIIRGYIKQARQAEKLDEVKMLEQNLKDLQREYLRQQRQNWS